MNSPSSRTTTSDRELSSDTLRSAQRGQTFSWWPSTRIHSLVHDSGWPEGGSSAHHWVGSSSRWRAASCTCFYFCAGTRPPAAVSLFSPPSCTAAAGSSSAVYWDAPPGRVWALLHKSADEQPSLFPAFAALYPVKTQTDKQKTTLKFSPFEKKRQSPIATDFCFNSDDFFCTSLSWRINLWSSLNEAPILLLTCGGFSSGIRG